MGSSVFAVPALQALCAAGHEVEVVYCQPSRPSGRGQRLTKCPVHQAADELGIPVRTPVRLKGNFEEAEYFRSLDVDMAIVAAYGLILPDEILSAPAQGCVNIHASLLPRWRGAAPIQAAILAGDRQTGVTIMRMDAGLDTGPMLLVESVAIGSRETAATLHDRLAVLGATLILQAVTRDLLPVPQPLEGMTYAPKLSRKDSRIDWREPAASIERRVRALTPWPGTETLLDDQALKIIEAEIVLTSGEPGIVLDDRMTIGCAENALRPTRVKLPGGAVLDVAAFLRGHAVVRGTRLG